MLARLVVDRLVIARHEIGGRMMDVVRVKITDAGRAALRGQSIPSLRPAIPEHGATRISPRTCAFTSADVSQFPVRKNIVTCLPWGAARRRSHD
jgi:hypothetical protein